MVGVRSPRFKVLSVLLSSCQPLSTTFLILIISFLSHVVYSKPGMILASLLTVVLAASFIGTTAQQVPIVYDSIHNATDLQGTWSSGAQNVVTGPVSFLMIQTSFTWPLVSQSFANPSNMSFNYPKTTGISYSLCVFSLPFWYHQADSYDCFSLDSGYFESARYRFNSNGVWNFNFLDCYALIRRQDHNQIASPAWYFGSMETTLWTLMDP